MGNFLLALFGATQGAKCPISYHNCGAVSQEAHGPVSGLSWWQYTLLGEYSLYSWFEIVSYSTSLVFYTSKSLKAF